MEKNFLTYKMEINGLEEDVKFNTDTIEKVFMPFLRELTDLHLTVDRKIVVYIAGAPGIGKTILAQFLEKLSHERKEVDNIRALSMDGFHYPNDYLESNTIEHDGKIIPLSEIKGAPETFDVDKLIEKIREVRQEGTDWNVYDRKIHDVLSDILPVEEDIILIDGNYLLLDEPNWTTVRVLCDYSVFIDVDDENLLRERLINRKVVGGLSREEAEKFFEFSDGKNIKRVRKNAAKSDEVWKILADGDIEKQ
ncbi:MAG: nucleoside/nucleotide kinase family protein [Selenomonadaceae bacterium]|nr:nucleoside/nucleotide kinase family protein [Selenomonadaceae bacterium]